MTPDAIETAIALRLPSQTAIHCAGTPAVASEQDKIHFTIAIFHELPRLAAALHDFRALGLGENDIWIAGKANCLARQLDWAEGLWRSSVVVGALPSGEMLYGTDGLAQNLMRAALCQNGKSCLQAILDGDIGAVLDEIAAEAVILTARTDDPALQDQSVRVLLRHSQHMVYSRECRLGITIGRPRSDI